MNKIYNDIISIISQPNSYKAGPNAIAFARNHNLIVFYTTNKICCFNRESNEIFSFDVNYDYDNLIDMICDIRVDTPTSFLSYLTKKRDPVEFKRVKAELEKLTNNQK